MASEMAKRAQQRRILEMLRSRGAPGGQMASDQEGEEMGQDEGDALMAEDAGQGTEWDSMFAPEMQGAPGTKPLSREMMRRKAGSPAFGKQPK